MSSEIGSFRLSDCRKSSELVVPVLYHRSDKSCGTSLQLEYTLVLVLLSIVRGRAMRCEGEIDNKEGKRVGAAGIPINERLKSEALRRLL